MRRAAMSLETQVRWHDEFAKLVSMLQAGGASTASRDEQAANGGDQAANGGDQAANGGDQAGSNGGATAGRHPATPSAATDTRRAQ